MRGKSVAADLGLLVTGDPAERNPSHGLRPYCRNLDQEALIREALAEWP
jgi:hypothetical protein